MKHILRLLLGSMIIWLSSCQPQPIGSESPILARPTLTAVTEERPLRIVATTSIIGDIVNQIGGRQIDLTILIKAGQDPHTYNPSPTDLAAAATADAIFVNGFRLEENLLINLANAAPNVPQIPVSAGIQPRQLGVFHHTHNDETETAHIEDTVSNPDPHTWMSPILVQQWVATIQLSLQELDPTHAATYAEAATIYKAALTTLDQEIHSLTATLPEEKRILVTNHDSLGYFADQYNYTIVGAVLPGTTALADPSASSLAALITTMREHQICTIFTENTASDKLARSVAAELSDCPATQFIPLTADAISVPGTTRDSYLKMMRHNAELIIQALKDAE